MTGSIKWMLENRLPRQALVIGIIRAIRRNGTENHGEKKLGRLLWKNNVKTEEKGGKFRNQTTLTQSINQYNICIKYRLIKILSVWLQILAPVKGTPSAEYSVSQIFMKYIKKSLNVNITLLLRNLWTSTI